MTTNYLSDINIKLKQRFCKEAGIPINIFVEPYFTERVILYQQFYQSFDKYITFVKECLKHYNNEEEYFADYNRVKDEAINFIKSTRGYGNFLEEDMAKFKVETKITSKDIFRPANDKHYFISIDMKKANFSALRYYDSSMFGDCSKWEDFIKKFTDNAHLINSKYLRQVILGNCNPRRQVTFEKYLMNTILKRILGEFPNLNIVYFSNDEIVIDVTNSVDVDIIILIKEIYSFAYRWIGVPIKVEHFELYKINGCYIKKGFELKIKCAEPDVIPFIIRALNGQKVQDNDKVFYKNGLLAKYIEIPKIEVPEELEMWIKDDN